jgi:hypothetical protein
MLDGHFPATPKVHISGHTSSMQTEQQEREAALRRGVYLQCHTVSAKHRLSIQALHKVCLKFQLASVLLSPAASSKTRYQGEFEGAGCQIVSCYYWQQGTSSLVIRPPPQSTSLHASVASLTGTGFCFLQMAPALTTAEVDSLLRPLTIKDLRVQTRVRGLSPAGEHAQHID